MEIENLQLPCLWHRVSHHTFQSLTNSRNTKAIALRSIFQTGRHKANKNASSPTRNFGSKKKKKNGLRRSRSLNVDFRNTISPANRLHSLHTAQNWNKKLLVHPLHINIILKTLLPSPWLCTPGNSADRRFVST